MADIISTNRFILCQMLSAHRRSFKKHFTIKVVVFILMSCVAIPISLSCIPKFKKRPFNSSQVLCTAGVSSLGAIWLTTFIIFLYGIYQRRVFYKILNSIFTQVSEPIVLRLEGNEWTDYLEHIYGKNQSVYFRRKCICWCYRRRRLAQLTKQGYGYIILVENAILLDRLFLYYLNKYPIQECQLIKLDSQQIAFRLSFESKLFHSTHKDDLYQVPNNRQIEIFIPQIIQEPKERLDQMVTLINVQTGHVKNTIPNFNEIRTLFE